MGILFDPIPVIMLSPAVLICFAAAILLVFIPKLRYIVLLPLLAAILSGVAFGCDRALLAALTVIAGTVFIALPQKKKKRGAHPKGGDR